MRETLIECMRGRRRRGILFGNNSLQRVSPRRVVVRAAVRCECVCALSPLRNIATSTSSLIKQSTLCQAHGAEAFPLGNDDEACGKTMQLYADTL